MISAVVLTKNEENNIVDCLESLKWCEEIVVIDDNSEDRTVELAKTQGATVYTRALDGDFAKQRNFGLEKAKGEWVFFVDADEQVSKALSYEILSHLSTEKPFEGYFVRRIDHMWGKKLLHGETYGLKLIRLAKKKSGIWYGYVHEKWEVKGTTGYLENPLTHYPHPTVASFLKEINKYSDIRVKELEKEKKSVRWISIIMYPLGKFLVNYFLKRGFLDGIPGLLVSTMMSFHSFLVRAKLWLILQKK